MKHRYYLNLLHGFLFTGILMLLSITTILSGCYGIKPSKGGGQIKEAKKRQTNASDILLAPGYKIERVAEGLTYPTACELDDQGRLYVIEAGYSYGEVWTEPKLIRLDPGGKKTIIATGNKNGPWNGIAYHEGNFYVSEGGELEGGKILRISPDGKITVLIENLPSFGDHHTNGPVIKDGYIYFGQGAATNSGVVGPDNASYGWLKRKPEFHDIPCRDIVLIGQNYESTSILDPAASKTSTGAFSAYGQATTANQIIKGSVPCTGAVMRIPLNGGEPQLVAWGLRNPYGLRFGPDNKLFVTDNGYDQRGSRPVWGAGDLFWEIKPGMWYGFPDFSAELPLQRDVEFKAPGEAYVQALLKTYPNIPPKPAAVLGVHSSSNGFDFSTSPSFGFEGEAFVAQFGDMAPGAGKVLAPVGFKIVRVNVKDGIIRDFAVNKGKRNGPASWLKSGGLERPVSARFNSSGRDLYVVDFGILQTGNEGPKPKSETGVIWKISKL
jgi:glucose/arabinose dehydrogenase